MFTPEDFAGSGSLDDQFSPSQEPKPLQVGLVPSFPQDPVKPQAPNLVTDRRIQNAILEQQYFAETVVKRLGDARNVDPQDYVNAERMAKSLNISVDQVFTDKDLALKLYREQQDRQSQIWNTAPELAKLLEDSAFAAKAQQSLDQYSYLERTSLAWEQGGLTVRRGELGLKSLNSTLTDEERQELDDLNERMSFLPAPAGEILPEAARIFGMQAEMSPETIGFGAVGALVGAGVGFFGGGGVGAAPGAAKGYFLASSAASAYKMYEIEAGNAYIDMIDEGIDPVQAADKATTIGLFNAAIELALAPIAGSGFRRLVNNQFVKRIAGDEAASETAKFLLLGRGFKSPFAQGAFDYGKALIAEPTEEALQEMILEYGKHAAALASRPEYRAAMEGMGNAEQESQAAEAFANAFWGMVAGGLVQGASGYYGASNSITQRAERARSNGEQLQKMIDTASNAKAVPALTRKLVTRLTEKHGNGDLSISVSDLLGVLDGMAAKASEGKAKPVTRDDMIAALRVADPDMGAQLDDAITNGGNGEVFVKTADFISKYVEKPTSEFYRQLVGHIRVIKDDATVPLSIMESKELLSKIDEIRRKEMEIIEREETPFRDAANSVRKQLSDLFATNTSMNEQERTAATDLLWTMAVVNARRTNTLPTLEFAGMPIQIAQVGKTMTAEEFKAIIGTEEALKVFAGEGAVTANFEMLDEAKAAIAGREKEISDTLAKLKKSYSDAFDVSDNLFGEYADLKRMLEGDSRKETERILANLSPEKRAELEKKRDEKYSEWRAAKKITEQSLKDLEAASKNLKSASSKNEFANQVRMETGWFQGRDGKWRFEISDANNIGGRYGFDFIAPGLTRASFDAQMELWLNQNSEYAALVDGLAAVEKETAEAIAEATGGDNSFLAHIPQSDKLNKLLARHRELKNKLKSITPTEKPSITADVFNSATGGKKGNNNNVVKLGELIKHEQLFEAYPFLKDMTVTFEDLGDGTDGALRGGSQIIFNSRKKYTWSEFKATILHETQHAIQGASGMDRGSSPFIAGSFQAYWNMPGEKEARNVEARMDMDPSEIKQKAPEVLLASTQTPAGLEATAAYITALNKIILKKNATFREVAHEIGHMVLEDVVFRAKNNKSQEDVDIANAILEWLGVTAGQNGSRIANWDSLPMDVKTEMHERLAYSYERYLETHKAPTKKLEGLFQRMSSILRGFWRNVKNGPAMVYRKIYGKELPILSSDAARALDLKLSLAHEIERSDIVAALSEVGMSKEEALAAGLNEDEWANLQKLKTESVEASIDYAVHSQLSNAAYYSKKFRAAHEKYQRFINKVREKIFGEERDKLLRESVYNLRNWAETGKAFDDQGNLVEITDGQSHKLNAAEVRAAHDKMVESLNYEIAQSMARIKRLDATKDAAEIKRLEDYIKLAKSVIKIDTLPALMSAHKVFILAKNAFADSQKSIEQFKEELLMGMVATALRTVRRSPLYVFRNIRSLIRANDDGKLNRQEVEDIIYSLLIEGSELNGFRASARIIASAARKAERNVRVGYARTAKDILDAFRIEFTLEAIEGTKAEQTKRIQARIEKLELKLATLVARHGEAKKKVQGTDKRNAKQIEKEMRAIQGEINTAREEWNRITTEVMEDTGKPKSQRVRKGSDIPNLPAEIAQMVDQLETLREEYDNLTRTGVVNGPMSEEVYNKILDVQVRLNKALAKEATGRLNKEMIKRIEADAAEQVEVNYPEFHGKLKASDVNAAVMEEVNRRVARYIMSKFLDGMVSDTGVAVAPYQKQSAEKTGNAKSFVLALIMAQQRGNQEEDVARERAEARLNNEFGKAATKMHVNASAKKLIADAIQEEKVLEAYSDYIAEDGMPIDFVRELFGYEDNDSMLIDLLTAQDIDDAALDNTDKRVKTMPELSNRKEIDRIVGEALANDMRVDIMKEEIKAIQTALQRMFEAGLTPEEKAKREAKRDAAMNQMKALQAERDELKKKQAGFKAVGDTKSADAAFNRIKSLNAEIRKLAVVAGAPLVTASEIRESAEHLAKSRMSEKLVREVKPTLFLTAARRAAQNAIRAMKGASTSKDKAGKQKDDYLVAYLDAKLDEMVNEMMWREAMKAERSRQKDKDFIATLFGDKNEIASDRDFNMVLAARAVAIIYGLRRGNMDEAVKAVEDIKVTDPKLYPYISQMVSVAMFEASDASFKSLKNRIVRATEEEADTKQLPPIYEELTMEQYGRLMSNLRYMWAEAKRLRELEDQARADLAKAIRDGAMKTLLERLKLVEQFKDKMSKLPIIGRWFAPKGSELADRATLPSALEEFLIKNMKMESFFLELDNDTPGWWTKNVWRPLSNANVDYSMRVAVYYEKYLALIEPIKDKLNEARTIAAPELTDKDGVAHVFGRDGGRGLGELFWLLTHIGDYGGYRRMIVGSGWGTITDGVLDDSKFVEFFERAKRDGLITDEMLEIIQNIGNLFEELRPEYKRVYMLAKRQPSVDVPVREVVGVKKKFKGWYMPAVINPKERETRVVGQDLDSALLALSEESTGNSAPFLPTNRGKDRNENYEQNAKALSADHLFIPQAFEQLIRFIHFYEPMSRVTTLLKGEGVADALNQYRPGIVMKGLLPWLQDIASRSGSKSSGDVARLMTQIRTTVVGTQMFGNIKVAFENVTGLFPALLEVEAKHVMRAVKQINFSPLKAKEEISNKSKFMRLYHKESMMELAMEIVNFVKKGGKLESVQEWTRKNSTFLVKQSQAWVSDIVWTAKYNEVLANAGPNAANMEEEAIEQADSAVRLTQNSFRIEDKTVYERGTEMAKFAFTYTGWFNMIRQLYSRKVKNSLLNDSLGQATAKAGVYFIAAYTIPSLLSAYIAAELYDKLDDDDEEKRDQFINEMVWGATLRTVLSGFPPIGSLAMQAIDAQAGKNYGRGAGENPIVGGLYRQLESLIKLVSLPVNDRDWTGRDTRNLVDAMSAALGIPSAGRPIGYIQALATDETETTGIIDFVRGLATGAYQK